MKFYSIKKAMGASIALIVSVLLLLVFASPVFAVSAAYDQIVLSWTADTTTTQTISWRASATSLSSVVQYVQGNGSAAFTNALQESAVRTELSEGYCHYEVTLHVLEAGKQYQYRVGLPEDWSNTYTFQTAEAGDDSFSFLYMGDVQEGYEAWGKMLDEAYSANDSVSFGLMGGDMVNMGKQAADWASFLAEATPVFSKIPMLTTIGNHELSTYTDGKPQLYLKTLALPNNGPTGFGEQFYSFDYGNAHFVVLDSNYMGESMDDANYAKVQTWLANDLAASTAAWKIALFHHPAYPIVSDSRAKPIRENWVPILEAGGVDVVFCGHQHEYMRTKPISNGTVVAEGGIVYIMGNAGSKYYDAGMGQPYIETEIAQTSNYQVIHIQGNNLEVVSYNAQHEQIDSWQKNKTSAVQPAENLQVSAIQVEPYAYQQGYTAVTLYNAKLPKANQQAILNWNGTQYEFYAAFHGNENRFTAIIPVAYEDLGSNAVAQMLAALGLAAGENTSFTYGDVYGSDSKIDVSDVIKAIHVIQNGTFHRDDSTYYALDVNGDDDLNMQDVQAIINHYLHGNAFAAW